MKKRGQAAIYIIIALFFVGAIVLIAWVKDSDEPNIDVRECAANEDCVASECCAAKLCVPKEDEPYCKNESGADILCFPGCFSYGDFKIIGQELGGCGGVSHGRCECQNNKCIPVFS